MTEITRIFDFPYYQLETYNLDKAFTTKYNSEWKSTSTKEYIDQANTISRGLLRVGVNPNDKIAVISSNNRTEWNIVDIGILQIGAQNVPIFDNSAVQDTSFLITQHVSAFCF